MSDNPKTPKTLTRGRTVPQMVPTNREQAGRTAPPKVPSNVNPPQVENKKK